MKKDNITGKVYITAEELEQITAAIDRWNDVAEEYYTEFIATCKEAGIDLNERSAELGIYPAPEDIEITEEQQNEYIARKYVYFMPSCSYDLPAIKELPSIDEIINRATNSAIDWGKHITRGYFADCDSYGVIMHLAE